MDLDHFGLRVVPKWSQGFMQVSILIVRKQIGQEWRTNDHISPVMVA
jgi:hypothetical protein